MLKFQIYYSREKMIILPSGSEMLVMGSITTLLHDHWELNAWVRGLLVSCVFVGFSVGNMLSGLIGDRYGRRKAVLISYAFIGIFGMLTAYCTNALMMVRGKDRYHQY
jgi:MFS transporter, AAHS family, benzoate transport protein